MFTFGKPWWCLSRWPFSWSGSELFPPKRREARTRAAAFLARALLLSMAVVPLWILATPLYDRAPAVGLDITLRIFEPHDMSHRVKLEEGRIKISRWVHGLDPIEFNITGQSISFNGAILIVLLLASPLPPNRRLGMTFLFSFFALCVFHVMLLYATAINPFPLLGQPYPASALPYMARLGPFERAVSGGITKALHGGGWAFAPVLIWGIATRKKCF